MRKSVYGRKLGRNSNSRKALYRSLVRGLVLEGFVVTTLAKAKAVQPEVEKLMSRVSDGTLSGTRDVVARIGNDQEVAKKLFSDYLKLSGDRKSGFTRIVTMPTRRGDNAQMAKLEWVSVPVSELVTEAKKAKKAANKKIGREENEKKEKEKPARRGLRRINKK